MRKTVIAAVAAAGLAALGIGGAAVAASGNDSPTSPAAVLSPADPAGQAADPGTPSAPPTARPTATPHDLDDDHGGRRGDDNGRHDDDGDRHRDSGTTAPAGDVKVTGDRAVELAVAHLGGGRVGEVELESEHGRAVWKIEVHDGSVEYDVRVDAGTGAIVRVTRDS